MWLKLKLTPKGDFCEVSVTGFFLFANFFMHSLKRYLNEQRTEVRPKSAKTSTHVTFVWESSWGSRSPSVPLDFS